MKRRMFMASCAAAAGAGTFGILPGTGAFAAAQSKRNSFEGCPIRFSLPPGWFKGSLDEQLAQIAATGAAGYEILGPPADPQQVRAAADKAGLQHSCITAVGSIAPGGMVNPADHDKLVEQFTENVAKAKVLGLKTVIGLTGNTRDDATYDEQMGYVVDCLKRLAPIAEENGIVISMEALNVLVDHGGYFLTTTPQTMAIIEAVGSPYVKMCFDIYHQQITEGNIIRNLTQNFERIGHIHVGDNPGRQEPGTGEINYYNVFKAIAEEGYGKGRYDGFVTFECGNSKDTERALQRIYAAIEWA